MEKKGLLVITQSAVKLNLIRHNLDSDYLIRSSENAEEAWTFIKYLRPELVILDENTPSFNTAAFCEAFRAFDENAPILIITRNLKKSYTRQMLQAGASDFLREPFDEEELLSRIEIASRSRKTEKKTSGLMAKISPLSEGTSKSFKSRVIVDDNAIQAVSTAQKDKQDLALLIAELDRKDPQLCAKFEQDLRKLLRINDLLSQVTEGKYVVIMPHTSKSAALLIAEEIQDALKTAPYVARIGVTDLGDAGKFGIGPEQSLDLMLNLASHCLLEAQLQGNLIVSQMKGMHG